MYIKRMDTGKLTFRESTVHEANNGQLCVYVMNKDKLGTLSCNSQTISLNTPLL